MEPKSSEESSQISSLAQLANRHLKTMEPKSSEESSQFSSLAQLASRHSKITEPKSSEESSHFSSLVQFAKKCSLLEVDNQLSEGHSFSSLAQLANRNGKVTKLQASHEDNNFSSLQKLANMHSGSEMQANGQLSPQVELASQHRVHRKDSISSLTDSLSEHLKVDENKTDELARDCGTASGLGSSRRAENRPVVRTPSEESNEMDWEIDLTNALISPGSKASKPKVTGCKLQEVEQEVPTDSIMLETSELMSDFELSSTILNRKLPNRKRKSPFGKTLCRKWKQLRTPYIPPQKQDLGKIVRFTFNTLSPDDNRLEHLKIK
jgi:hypothetical protein